MNGVSKFFSPLMILEGIALDYHRHFRVSCGELLQTCEDTRNDTILHTIDALVLGPNTNLQGGIRCSIWQLEKCCSVNGKMLEYTRFR